MRFKFAVLALFSSFFLIIVDSAHALIKGIYITQSMFENTQFVNYLIVNAKQTGISTFIVDMEKPSKRYQNNIAFIKGNQIRYIARIVMFPGGGKSEEITSEKIWEKKYQLIKTAINMGADQIQLDYIRYDTKQGASSKHAENIHKIIKFYKERLVKLNIPLQIDVFGISSFGEEKNIGQNIKLFSQSADVICPMVYPSHYEPYRLHAVRPYETVYDSLLAIRNQFDNKALPFKLIPYIELSNYRYPLSQDKKLNYIYSQIKAAEAAGADGWYAWSAHNQYENLFQVLRTYGIK